RAPAHEVPAVQLLPDGGEQRGAPGEPAAVQLDHLVRGGVLHEVPRHTLIGVDEGVPFTGRLVEAAFVLPLAAVDAGHPYLGVAEAVRVAPLAAAADVHGAGGGAPAFGAAALDAAGCGPGVVSVLTGGSGRALVIT